MSQAYCSLKTVNTIGRYSLAIKYWFCYAVEQHCWNDKNVSVEFKFLWVVITFLFVKQLSTFWISKLDVYVYLFAGQNKLSSIERNPLTATNQALFKKSVSFNSKQLDTLVRHYIQYISHFSVAHGNYLTKKWTYRLSLFLAQISAKSYKYKLTIDRRSNTFLPGL